MFAVLGFWVVGKVRGRSWAQHVAPLQTIIEQKGYESQVRVWLENGP